MPRPRILINALHTTTGGGVTYLRGILNQLAQDERFDWLLFAPKETLAKIMIPAGIEMVEAPSLGFWSGHVYEQLWLPFLCRKWGVKAVLCNANYVPLLAPRPLPIIHTTPRAAAQALSVRMKIYWAVLKGLTTLSVWRAPAAFAVAKHVIADYVGPRAAQKVRVAYPAVNSERDETVDIDANLVMTVGDFYPQKNYPLLLQAFAILREQRPKSRLLVIGRPVDAAVRDQVFNMVRELGIADAVTLTGAVPHDVLMTTLSKAAVYINTSGAECFNIPVLEALQMGVPCVLPDVDFQREVAGEAAVYVPMDKGGDVAGAFAVAMYGLLENEEVAKTLRRRGLTRARAFSWEKTAHVLADALAIILKVD